MPETRPLYVRVRPESKRRLDEIAKASGESLSHVTDAIIARGLDGVKKGARIVVKATLEDA